MKIGIIGAGLSGLLCGRMLKNLLPQAEIVIYEKQKGLPNNHGALLRFRGLEFSNAVSIPFEKVTVIKEIDPYYDSKMIASLQYTHKTTGIARTDRSITDCPCVVTRYIAPRDLVAQLAVGQNILYDVVTMNNKLQTEEHDAVVSTIPMPSAMELLGYETDAKFHSRLGYTIRVKLDDYEAYCTMYFPDPEDPIYRISITGDELIIECIGEYKLDYHPKKLVVEDVMAMLDIKTTYSEELVVHANKYQKILPVNKNIRQDFMMWATDQHNIFSLGRFATWRPGLQLDDLVHDVHKITGWINQKYRMRKERA